MLSIRAWPMALIGLVASAAFVLPPGGTSSAEAATTQSSNWAGYAVTGARFRRVTGSWTVSRGSCTSGSEAYSAHWLGLGGFDPSSQALEQTGTEFDCGRWGRPSYYAWYEMVPALPRNIRMKVRPGNRIYAAVTVQGRRVTLLLRNVTTHRTFRKVAQMSSPAPDVSSAEWIVEAPSGCDSSGRCYPLPLSNFGTTRFTGASATTTDGHTGTITDASWASTAIQLNPVSGPFVSSGKSAGSAAPSTLSPSGSAFSVSYSNGSSNSARQRTTFTPLARR